MTASDIKAFTSAFVVFIREEIAKNEAKHAAELAKLRQDIDALTALLAEKEANQ